MSGAPAVDIAFLKRLAGKLSSGPRKVVMDLPGPAAEPTIFLVTYAAEFDRLWRLIDEPPIAGMSPIDFVVHWSGFPANAGDAHLWLTPYDWLLAFAQATKNRPVPWRVFLVDLSTAKSSDAVESKVDPIAYGLSWVRLYTVAPKSRTVTDGPAAPITHRIFHFNEDQLLADLGSHGAIINDPNMAEIWATGPKEMGRLLKHLCAIWANDIMSAGNRHSISNLIAPLLMARDLADRGITRAASVPEQLAMVHGESANLNYLAWLLEKIGLGVSGVGVSTSKITSPLLDNFVKRDIFDRFASLNFLLVDDRALYGFHELVSLCLFGDAHVQASQYDTHADYALHEAHIDERTHLLHSRSTPDVLLSWLAEAVPLATAGECCLIGASNSKGLEKFDILFLDLRLFDSDGGDAQQEEKRFLSRLLELCSKDLRSNAQIGAAARAAKRFIKGEEVAGYDRLLLLPLLLAYADPSLPIIIFSSTHRRALLDRLRHLPNVVTHFSKPTIGSNSEDVDPDIDVPRHLRTAITQALRLHEKRAIWQRLARLRLGPAPLIIQYAYQPPSTGQGREAKQHDHRAQKKSDFSFRLPNPRRKTELEMAYLRNSQPNPPVMPKTKDFTPILRSHFTKYIQGALYSDYASIPTELLERVCVLDERLENPDWRNIDASYYSNPEELDKFWPRPFNLGTPADIHRQNAMDLARRNGLVNALSICRNRKVHGFGPDSGLATDSPAYRSDDDPDDLRVAAMLQFLVLIDFLEGVGEPPKARLLAYAECLDHTIKRLGGRLLHWWQARDQNPINPRHITSIVGFHWMDFALLCLLTLGHDAQNYLHETTHASIVKLAMAKEGQPSGLAP